MNMLKLIVLIYAVFLGIPSQIIDWKHLKRKAYLPGNAWGHYSKLSREGSLEAKFVMLANYAGIALIIGTLIYFFYTDHQLSKLH